ncbi:UNVERIFIED_CONTAM: hypothetical protein Sradi_1984300 [Sesamum radiatum]|uniref:Uncharacterized protein n=1 Tax=Sesamum radiatum TaxID=300843 RepID=A0AAW2TEP3_SESRA
MKLILLPRTSKHAAAAPPQVVQQRPRQHSPDQFNVVCLCSQEHIQKAMIWTDSGGRQRLNVVSNVEKSPVCCCADEEISVQKRGRFTRSGHSFSGREEIRGGIGDHGAFEWKFGEFGSFGGGFDDGKISEVLDVYLHIGGYVPPVFGVRGSAAHLAVVGRGRDFANAKYSDWVRLRKPLEKLRPPSVNELLLSNDGEQILEGCLTNFFVVCLKEKDGDCHTVDQKQSQSLRCIEVRTAPLNDGVLPGVIRQVIRDICLKTGIAFREVAPSWSKRELWMEAFITNSLRILQHVETIQAPKSWKSVESNTWEKITWVEKRFQDGPGRITSMLQMEIMKEAGVEAFPVTSFEEGWPVV